MNWLIILLVLVVAIGPVFYLLPTKRDKRLTALRAYARRLGLGVKITRIPKLDASADERVTAGGIKKSAMLSCVAYEVPLGDKVEHVGELLLLKLPGTPTQHVDEVLPGWALASVDQVPFWRLLQDRLGSARALENTLAALPEDAVACSLDARVVACYWQEKADVDEQGESMEVRSIKTVLESLRDDLVATFAPGVS